MRRNLLVIASILVLVFLAVTTVQAKPFYEGKVIKIIAATKPGGGYDWYARIVAKFMEKYLPGSTFIVKNVPGAGHIIGTNETYLSKPNGLTIGTFNRAVGLPQVVGLKGVKFDFPKLNFLGSPCSETYAYIVNAKMFKNIWDVKNYPKKIRLASTGLGTVSYVNPLMLYQAWDQDNYTIATGYSGAEMEMALMRGECDGIWSSVSSRQGILESGKARIVLLVGRHKPKGWENVPFIEDVLKDPKDKPIVKLLRGIQLVGRPFALPPGVPADRLKILRDAFEKACKDPEAIAIAKKANRPMDFVTWQEAQDWAKGFMELSPNVVDKLKEAFGVKQIVRK